jgi:sodium/proline symporter
MIWLGRAAVVVIALLATYLAWDPDNSVLGLVAYAWAGFGAAFGPVLILSLYWRRMNGWGALAGMVSGGLGVVVWRVYGDSALYEIVPGFAIALITAVLVSALTPAPARAVTAVFDRAASAAQT